MAAFRPARPSDVPDRSARRLCDRPRRAASAVLTAAIAVGMLAGCAFGPSSQSDLCSAYDELAQRVAHANGLFDNAVFSSAGDLGDIAERYPDSSVSAEADGLRSIADSDSTSSSELTEATGQIGDTCGHSLTSGSSLFGGSE